ACGVGALILLPFSFPDVSVRRRGGNLGRRRSRRGARALAGCLRLVLGHPVVEGLLGHRLDHDRHEAVIGAAKLRALAVVDAGASTLNQVSFKRPGTASSLTPKEGTAQEWM